MKKLSREHLPAYTPNQVTRSKRAANLFLAWLLMGYGLAGLLTHTMKFSRRGRVLIFLDGGSAWLMALACIVGAFVFFSWVVDHHDTRNNEAYYSAFRWIATRVGWALVAASLIVHFYVGFTK
jgi:hypothetical protein